MIFRVAPIYGHFKYPMWNGPANSIPILNENRPIIFIRLSLKKDPFPLISYSHIPERNSRAAPPPFFWSIFNIRGDLFKGCEVFSQELLGLLF